MNLKSLLLIAAAGYMFNAAAIETIMVEGVEVNIEQCLQNKECAEFIRRVRAFSNAADAIEALGKEGHSEESIKIIFELPEEVVKPLLEQNELSN